MAKTKERGVLFLCTGNYYRSRFAEIVFNAAARKLNLPWVASSRGLALERGVNNVGPISRQAVEALHKLGLKAEDACGRFPQAVTASDFESAERVIALKRTEHEPLLHERFPAWTGRVEYWHIDDAPEALALIEQEVPLLLARLLGGGRQVETTPTPAPAKPKSAPPSLTAKVGRETAGRRGKGVTTVFDLPLNEADLNALAGQLKQRCGTGGTVKDGRIEIQGDQRERVMVELEKLGYKVKRAGG